MPVPGSNICQMDAPSLEILRNNKCVCWFQGAVAGADLLPLDQLGPDLPHLPRVLHAVLLPAPLHRRHAGLRPLPLPGTQPLTPCLATDDQR